MAPAARKVDRRGLLIARPDSIMTYSGIWIQPLNPDPADIRLEDIATALSNMCRWTGHVSTFYSVAEHSVLASLIDPRLETLLHDGSEAYLCDLARPVKHAPGLGEHYLAAESRLEQAIALRFGLRWPMDAKTRAADEAMLKREAERLKPGLRGSLPPPPKGTPIPRCWTPEEAKWAYLRRAQQLGLESQ